MRVLNDQVGNFDEQKVQDIIDKI